MALKADCWIARRSYACIYMCIHSCPDSMRCVRIRLYIRLCFLSVVIHCLVVRTSRCVCDVWVCICQQIYWNEQCIRQWFRSVQQERNELKKYTSSSSSICIFYKSFRFKSHEFVNHLHKTTPTTTTPAPPPLKAAETIQR